MPQFLEVNVVSDRRPLQSFHHGTSFGLESPQVAPEAYHLSSETHDLAMPPAAAGSTTPLARQFSVKSVEQHDGIGLVGRLQQIHGKSANTAGHEFILMVECLIVAGNDHLLDGWDGR